MVHYTEKGLHIIIEHTAPDEMRDNLLLAISCAMHWVTDINEDNSNYRGATHSFAYLLEALVDVDKKSISKAA